MRFAAIADIHGNSDALRAVLADIDRQGIADVVNLGDHFSGPLDARGTAAILRERGFPSVRGNHDRWLVEHNPARMAPSDAIAHAELEARDLNWLRALPATLEHGGAFLCHATPGSDTTYWLEHVTAEGVVAASPPARIEGLLGGIGADLILCGHTHTQRAVRLRGGQMIVNPGSVGCPGYTDDRPVPHVVQTGSPDACYAVLEKSGGAWSVTFRQVPYDASAMVGLALERGRPEWARVVGTGWIEEPAAESV